MRERIKVNEKENENEKEHENIWIKKLKRWNENKQKGK